MAQKEGGGVLMEKAKWWYYPVAAVLLVIFLLPLYVLLNISFRTIQDIGSKLAFPRQWYFGNYVDAFFHGDLLVGFKNSIILTVETVFIEIVATTMKEKCGDSAILYENLWDRQYMPSGMWPIFENATSMLFDDHSGSGVQAAKDYLRQNYMDLYEAAQAD